MTTPSPDAQFAAKLAELRRDTENLIRSMGAVRALQWLAPPESFSGDRARVVVVGEVGSGKTSLINAVLHRADLLPTTPTTTYVGIGRGDRPEFRVHLHNHDVVTGVPSDVGRWIPDEQVAHIEILLDEPWLDRLSLFDTPGIGGIDSAARALTLDALRDATALVFVCSAEAKISLSERAFLNEATKRIEQVVFVLSKVDLLDDLGQANLREDEETVLADCRFAPGRFGDVSFLPFSAHLAALGAAGDEQALADSGVAALRHRLETIAASYRRLAELNQLRAIRSSLSEASRHLLDRKRALQEPDNADRRESLNARYLQITERRDTWRQQFNREFDHARGEVLFQFRSQLRELGNRYERRLAAPKAEEIKTTEATLVEDLCELHRETAAAVKAQVQEIARQMLSLAGAEDDDDLADRIPDPRQLPSDYIAGRVSARSGPGEGMRRAQALYLAEMMMRNAHLGPLAPVAGIGWYLLQQRMTKRAQDVAELRSWTTKSINDARLEITDEIERAFKHASYLLVDAIDHAFAQTLEAIAEERAVLASAATDSSRERRHLGTAEPKLAELMRECDTQLEAVAAQLPAPHHEKLPPAT